jgi:hypothetical protein
MTQRPSPMPRKSEHHSSENRFLPTLRARIRKLFHYWFVQYNPLYFVSALCVLFGMFLVSRGLEEMGWTPGQIILTAVIQAYEILLITGAAILFRSAGERRPGVILGLLEVFFLFDCTFQTEIVASMEGVGVALTIAWIAMMVLKLTALKWVFRLTFPIAILGIPVIAAIGLAGTPYILQSTMLSKSWTHLFATWLGFGLVYAVLLIRPTVASTVPLDDWGRTVLRRSAKSAFMIWTGYYFYHVITWFGMFNIGIIPAHLAPFILLFPFKYKTENSAWWCASLTFVLSLLQSNLMTVSPIAMITGIACGLQGRRLKQPRLYVGAVVLVHIGIWTIGWQMWPPPAQKWWLNLLTGAALLTMAWRMRLMSALIVVIIGVLPVLKKIIFTVFAFLKKVFLLLFSYIKVFILTIYAFFKAVFLKIYLLVKAFLPQGPLGWGILLLAVGFAALIIGVAINWRQRQRK